jgi:putative NADH-flavin reductase
MVVIKIGLLGATGATGVLVLEQALAAGHTVKALARNPLALQSHAKLTVIKGDVDNQAAIDQVIEGVDVVICTLGARKNLPGTNVVTKGVDAALKSMNRFGVKRFIVVTSSMVNKRTHNSGVFDMILYAVLHDFALQYIYEDLEEAERILQERAGENIVWTLVQPPMLVPAKAVGYAMIVDAVLPGGTGMLPFADLATSLLEIAVKGSYPRAKVHVNTCSPCTAGEDPKKLYAQVQQVLSDAFHDRVLPIAARAIGTVAVVAAAVFVGRRLIASRA